MYYKIEYPLLKNISLFQKNDISNDEIYDLETIYKKMEKQIFLTKQGVNKYFESGLQEMHQSEYGIPSNVGVLKNPFDLDFEDENQIICSSNEILENISWDIFCETYSKYPLVEKVVGYITRNRRAEKELLVFDHDEKFLDAGVQVPAGTLELGETTSQSILREMKEESGLIDINIISHLDCYCLFNHYQKKFHRRHVFLLESEKILPEKWSHQVTGYGTDAFLNFHYYWLPLNIAKIKLFGNMGYSIDKI